MISNVERYQTRAGFRAVVFLETTGDHSAWVAMCLEKDICAQGNSLEQVKERIETALFAHVALSHEMQRPWFQGVDTAPRRFFDMWQKAK